MAKKHDLIDKLDKYIGNKIYVLRLAHGLSRQQLAEKVGVTHQQIQKYEKGINRISAGRLLLVSKTLEKQVAFFFSGFEDSDDVENNISHSQRLCIEVSRNFMKLDNPDHQNAVNTLIKSLIVQSA